MSKHFAAYLAIRYPNGDHMPEQPAKREVARGQPCLPNLLIIGAAKAGTTSLHGYLSEHPDIFMSRHKELSFFDDKCWSLGIEWYKSNFDSSYAVNGEASPRYTLYPKLQHVPERIRQVLGTPKMIYTIRDPIDQILSLHTQNLEHWPGTPALEVTDPQFPQTEYMMYSKYYSQLRRYLEFFPREAIHIVIMERLNADPKKVLREIFRFVGVDEDFWTEKFNRRLNAGEAKRHAAEWYEITMPSPLKRQISDPTWLPNPLAEIFRGLSRIGGERIQKPKISDADDFYLQALLRDDVAQLRTLLGDPLPEWRSYA